MRLYIYALLMLCLAVGAYVFGCGSAFTYLLSLNGQPADWGTFASALAQAMLNPTILAILVGAAVGSVFITGFSGIYVLALILFVAIANVILLPVSYFSSGMCGLAGTAPNLLTGAWQILMNLLLLATLWEFTRGGG